jgi:hypothetical protein
LSLEFADRKEIKMSCGLAVQTNRYGAINMIELSYDGHALASLIQEGATFVDYRRRRVFRDIDTAIEFYLAQIAHPTNSGILAIGYAPAKNGFVIHDSCLSFPV